VGHGYVASRSNRRDHMVVKKAVRRKVTEEKKAIGRFEMVMKSWQFPVQR